MLQAFFSFSRSISRCVLLAFAWMVICSAWNPAMPLAAAAPSAPAPTIVANADDEIGLIEQSAPQQVSVKKKGFPWLLVGLGVVLVAGGVGAYLLLKKTTESVSEEFDSTASSLWLPYNPSEWSVANGYYTLRSSVSKSTGNFYNKSWSKNVYTVTMRMMKQQGGGTGNTIMLSTNPTILSVFGYVFGWSSDGEFYIYKATGYNLYGGSGDWEWIKDWTSNAAVKGIGAWNEVKVERNVNTYKYSINGVLLHTFTDATHDPRYIGMSVGVYGVSAVMNYDWIHFDIGSASSSSPAMTTCLVPSRTTGQDPNRR